MLSEFVGISARRRAKAIIALSVAVASTLIVNAIFIVIGPYFRDPLPSDGLFDLMIESEPFNRKALYALFYEHLHGATLHTDTDTVALLALDANLMTVYGGLGAVKLGAEPATDWPPDEIAAIIEAAEIRITFEDVGLYDDPLQGLVVLLPGHAAGADMWMGQCGQMVCIVPLDALPTADAGS